MNGGDAAEYPLTLSGDTGNPATNHFYIVRAINCDATTPDIADSSEIGEFDFAIEPGT